VTIEGETMHLDRPFMVLATQNPIEQEGVYPLPEAQVDRFLMKILVDYPEPEAELEMILHYREAPGEVQRVAPEGWVVDTQKLVERVHVDDTLAQYLLALAHATRAHPAVSLGVSPRACLALLHTARARALLYGRDYVIPDDVQEVAPEVLQHRVILSPEAELEGLTSRRVVEEVLERTAVPRAQRRTA